MKIKYALVAAAFASLLPMQAMAHPRSHHHHHHRDSVDTLGLILGATIVGGAIYYGTQHQHHYRGHHHHRRHKPVRVVDSYRRGGREYVLCRQGKKYFYC